MLLVSYSADTKAINDEKDALKLKNKPDYNPSVDCLTAIRKQELVP